MRRQEVPENCLSTLGETAFLLGTGDAARNVSSDPNQSNLATRSHINYAVNVVQFTGWFRWLTGGQISHNSDKPRYLAIADRSRMTSMPGG